MPTLEDSLKTPVTSKTPYEWTSRIKCPLTTILEGRVSTMVSLEKRPDSKAEAIEKDLITDPGSKISVSALLRYRLDE